MELNKVHNIDVLDGLGRLPDGSVNLVLTDPPYNIGKAAWDTIDNYVEWCGKWLKECERILKPNGILVFWHNDFVQTSQLVTWINNNTRMSFNSVGLWHKPMYRNVSWKNRSEKSNLRSWFNVFEWFVAYEMNDDGGGPTGLEQVLSNPELFQPLKQWYASELERLGITKKDIAAAYTAATGRKPHMLKHYFQNSQFEIPTRKVWESVYEPLGFNKSYESLSDEYEALHLEYEALRLEYEAMRPPFNIVGGQDYSNYFRDEEEVEKMGKTLPHPCMKPLNIIERLVQTYSREGDIVLDCFMGSGQTAIACERLGRQWIGIERDADYCKLAERRIKEARA